MLRAGYEDAPAIGLLNSSYTQRPNGVPDAATYWKSFSKLDRIRRCRIAQDGNVSTDPNLAQHDEL